MRLLAVLKKHGVTQRALAAETGLPMSTISAVVHGQRCPTTGTVNRLLRFVRIYEPKATYDQLFGDTVT